MLTEDYIMRMINQALVVLRRILRMRETGQHQAALQEVDQALEQLLGLKAGLIRVLDDESLLDSLTQNDRLDVDRLYLVAELAKVEGEVLLENGQLEESYLSSLRALNFFLEVALQGNLQYFSDPHDKIAELLKRLEGVKLEVKTAYPLFCYFEQEKLYGAADRTLTELGYDPSLADETRLEQIAFFERLLEKPDEDLVRGGLPRAEVKARLDGLQNLWEDEG
jgi:hypothetical protein